MTNDCTARIIVQRLQVMQLKHEAEAYNYSHAQQKTF